MMIRRVHIPYTDIPPQKGDICTIETTTGQQQRVKIWEVLNLELIGSERRPSALCRVKVIEEPGPIRIPLLPEFDELPVEERWQGKGEILAVVNEWAEEMQVSDFTVQFDPPNKAWGCMAHDGVMNLSLDLLTLPKSLGIGVIVHELVHRKAPGVGHTRIFQLFMSAYLPDWRAREKRLNLYQTKRVLERKAERLKQSVIRIKAEEW
jgi:hypothetical protein